MNRKTQLMHEMVEGMKGMTRDVFTQSANFNVTVRLIREVAARLNVTHSLAAEYVAGMKIDIANDAYREDPEIFHEAVTELARFLGDMFVLLGEEFDADTAHAYIGKATNTMSITYNN